ncbi:hypothetical protein [Georgenia subflava]|uniref:Uncharacterized protein n=1 Tax=Georgenia subflava TaxID=1622177 RepID=A0A6N7ENI0_9MICO|nr:hypothetical protein [Georgenia subflava]MPV38653.1 hypothetical protein [Georgenia subflava]
MNDKQNEPSEEPTAEQPVWSAAPSAGSAPGPGAADTGSTDTVWSATTVPAPAVRRGARTGTLILGLILTLCGIGAIAVALGYSIDLQLAVIVVLVVAALTLLIVPLTQRGRKDRAGTD